MVSVNKITKLQFIGDIYYTGSVEEKEKTVFDVKQ